MKTKTLFILCVVLFCLSASAIVIPFGAASSGWTKIYIGGSGNNWPNKMISTSDGGFALAGFLSSTAGGENFWFVKTDSSGNQLWNRTYGGTGDDQASWIIQTTDGGYALVGFTTSFNQTTGYPDVYLVKTDANGTETWFATYGGPLDDEGNAVIQTSDEGYAIAGFTTSLSNSSTALGWLIKVDSSGKLQWNNIFGGVNATDNDLYCLVQTNDGGYALAGYTNTTANGEEYWLVKTDSNGTLEWSQTYGGTGDDTALCLIKTTDGGYALAGTQASFGGSGAKAWLVKTDSNGKMQWNQTYPGEGSSYAITVIQTSDGGYALVGGTAAYLSSIYTLPFLVKTDSSGNMQWNQTFDLGYEANSLVQTSDGSYVIAGEWGYPNFPADGWMTKKDENGNITPTPTPTPVPTGSPSASTSPTPTAVLHNSSTPFTTYIAVAVAITIVAVVAVAFALRKQKESARET